MLGGREGEGGGACCFTTTTTTTIARVLIVQYLVVLTILDIIIQCHCHFDTLPRPGSGSPVLALLRHTAGFPVLQHNNQTIHPHTHHPARARAQAWQAQGVDSLRLIIVVPDDYTGQVGQWASVPPLRLAASRERAWAPNSPEAAQSPKPRAQRTAKSSYRLLIYWATRRPLRPNSFFSTSHIIGALRHRHLGV